MIDKKNILVIIPARKGSSELKNKNLILIYGKPLIYYTIKIAKKFESKNNQIFCSTNSLDIKKICEKNSLKVPFLRPNSISKKLSRDIDFVNHALKNFNKKNIRFKYGLILRPTSPIRNYNIIKEAFTYFKKSNFDSIRAIVKIKTPVFKMWFKKKNNRIIPAVNSKINEHYNAPRQILPETFFQTSNFEFFKINYKVKIISISGNKIGGYLTQNKYDHDIDDLNDISKLKKIKF